MNISRYQFGLYQKVRNGGFTNMMDTQEVSRLSGLTRDQIIYIIGNYGELKVKYEPIEDRHTISVSELKEGNLYKGKTGVIRKIRQIRGGMVYYDALARNKRIKPRKGINTLAMFADWAREIV